MVKGGRFRGKYTIVQNRTGEPMAKNVIGNLIVVEKMIENVRERLQNVVENVVERIGLLENKRRILKVNVSHEIWSSVCFRYRKGGLSSFEGVISGR